jgi:CRISPR type III-associated protein (TIGR04423 family)
MSDEKEPIKFEGSDLSQVELTKEPFIVEGNLYSEENNISVSIKHIDGEYWISKIDLNEIDKDDESIVEHRYRANNKLKSIGKYLLFYEYWHPEKDKQCLDMEVLKPNWIAFAGFTNEEDKNEL